MKKGGIINRGILKGIGEIGHTDAVMICDSGFPIPKDAQCVDLSLVKGTPRLEPVLDALLEEMVVEAFYLHDEMPGANPEGYAYVQKKLTKQTGHEVNFEVLKEKASQAKLIIRTGEIRPCSNIILIAASGVPEMVEKYI